MKKNWWVLALLVLLAPLVFASWDSFVSCRLNQTCEVGVFTVNTSAPLQLLNISDCFITIWNDDDYSTYLVYNASMDQMNASQGFHNYTISFSDTGHYPALVQCNGTDVTDSKDLSFEIINQTAIFNSTGLFGGSSPLSNWGTAVIIAMLTIVGVLSYYAIKLTSLNKWLRLFLFLGSFLMLILTVNVARLIVEEISSTSTDVISLLDTSHLSLIFMFTFIFGILLVMFVFGMLDNVRKGKGDVTP